MNILPKNPVKTLVTIAYAVIFVLFITYLLPRIITYLLPFILAWIISLIIKPIVRFLKMLHIPQRLAVVISMLLVIGVIVCAFYFLSAALVKELQTVVDILQQTSDGMPVLLKNLIERLPGGLEKFAMSIAERTEGDLMDFVYPAAKSALSKLGGAAVKLPSALVFSVAMILAAYFISNDSGTIKAELKKYIPEEKLINIRTIKQKLYEAFGGYARAQLILMLIVFCILLTGFLILDVKLALLLAAVISFLDAIPVLGTGIFLNPWALVCLIQGDYFKAIGLVCLYFVVLFTRQFIEPKVISGQIGLHPLFTLAAMYVGLKTIGVSGMIFGPILLIIAVNALKIKAELEQRGEIDERN